MDYFCSFMIFLGTVVSIIFIRHKYKKQECCDCHECLEKESINEILQCYIEKSKKKDANQAELHRAYVETLLRKVC